MSLKKGCGTYLANMPTLNQLYNPCYSTAKNIGNLFEATFAVNDKFYQTHFFIGSKDVKLSFFLKDRKNDLVLKYSHS